MKKQVELVQGTLDMLILKAVSLGGLHGYGVLLRLQQLTGGQLQIQQGSLYPALYRLERQGLIVSQWGESDNKRKAKFYALTAAGRKKLKTDAESWNRFSMVVASVLGAIPEGS
jgi:transcriptional regulator